MSETLHRAQRFAHIAGIALTALVLSATFVLLFAEAGWSKPTRRSPRDAFLDGDTGTELMPLPVFRALPILFPDQFQPGGAQAGDWIDQFGFVHGTPDRREGLPVGFFLSNHRPKSGTPSPVRFVGVNCSLCHTSRIKRSDQDPGVLVHGMGSTSLDFIAWVDAFKTALMDEKRLTLASIDATNRAQGQPALSLPEKAMIALWMRQVRDTLQESVAKVDAPFSGAELRDAQAMPNGPSRTQPFRNLVRNIMNRPAMLDRGFCKFPVLFQQKGMDWGQFDGSVHSRLTRSVLAAIAIGATKENLVLPDISQNVTSAIEYTLTLPGPRFAETFPDQRLDEPRASRGREVYLAHCDSCHGHPGSGGWMPGARQGEVVPATTLGTDAERVTFRYYEELADHLVAYFPEKHALRPKREDLRPGPLGTVRGYINKPLDSAFARAPFLHNASVLTLAELINLKPRRPLFYRGDNLFDVVDVGLATPAAPDARRYFRFDTSERGNSNRGHDYPWPYRGAGWNEADLTDLLEFLKTL